VTWSGFFTTGADPERIRFDTRIGGRFDVSSAACPTGVWQRSRYPRRAMRRRHASRIANIAQRFRLAARYAFAVLAGAILIGAPSAGAAGRLGPRVLGTDNSNQFQVRPRSMVVGMVSIDSIHWARWSTTANGRGVARVPSAGGGLRPTAATIRAWRARRGVYTRLWWAYGSGSGRYTESDVLLQGSGAHFWRVCAFPGYRSNSPVCR
jgi:hypothetical protein